MGRQEGAPSAPLALGWWSGRSGAATDGRRLNHNEIKRESSGDDGEPGDDAGSDS